MPKISVILPTWIVNYELYDLTNQTLISLHNSDGWSECELIIIDNSSPIGGDQLLMNCDVYIRNKENLGYPKAVNQGLKLAKGDLIVIANNDIRVSPNWIEITKETFKRLDNVGSLHFKMVGYDEPFNLGEAVWDKGKERWCTGSFFVWNKKAIRDIENFKTREVIDEKYGLGGYDDWDWHHRMNHLKNWKSVYTNAAAYQHKDSTTQNLRNKDERTKSDERNREYFKSKFGKYPEEIWQEKYPNQMKKEWRPFP